MGDMPPCKAYGGDLTNALMNGDAFFPLYYMVVFAVANAAGNGGSCSRHPRLPSPFHLPGHNLSLSTP